MEDIVCSLKLSSSFDLWFNSLERLKGLLKIGSKGLTKLLKKGPKNVSKSTEAPEGCKYIVLCRRSLTGTLLL